MEVLAVLKSGEIPVNLHQITNDNNLFLERFVAVFCESKGCHILRDFWVMVDMPIQSDPIRDFLSQEEPSEQVNFVF